MKRYPTYPGKIQKTVSPFNFWPRDTSWHKLLLGIWFPPIACEAAWWLAAFGGMEWNWGFWGKGDVQHFLLLWTKNWHAQVRQSFKSMCMQSMRCCLVACNSLWYEFQNSWSERWKTCLISQKSGSWPTNYLTVWLLLWCFLEHSTALTKSQICSFTIETWNALTVHPSKLICDLKIPNLHFGGFHLRCFGACKKPNP